MNTSKNIVFSLASVASSAASSLLLVPLITNYLGVDAYGYIGVCAALVNAGTIVSLAITSLATRYIIISLNAEDGNFARVINSILFGCVVIAAILVGIFVALIANLPHIINVQPEYISQVKILFLFMGLSLVVNILGTPFVAGLYYVNDLRPYYVFQSLSQLSRIVIPLVAFNLITPYLFLPYAAAFIVDTFALGFYFLRRNRYFPSFKISVHKVQLKLLKEILCSGSWVSISKAGDVLLSTISTYLTNILLGVYLTGVFAAIMQLQGLFAVLTNSIISALVPNILKMYTKLDSQSYVSWLDKYIRLVAVFVGFIAGLLAVFGDPFLELWLNEGMKDYSLVVALVLIGAGLSYPFEVHNQALIAFNKVKLPSLVAVIFGVFNVLMTCLFCVMLNMGLLGIALAQFMSLVIRGWVFYPIYLNRVCGGKDLKIYKGSIVGVVAMAISGGVSYVLLQFMTTSWGGLISFTAIAAVLSFVLIYKFLFTFEDRTLFKTLKSRYMGR